MELFRVEIGGVSCPETGLLTLDGGGRGQQWEVRVLCGWNLAVRCLWVKGLDTRVVLHSQYLCECRLLAATECVLHT